MELNRKEQVRLDQTSGKQLLCDQKQNGFERPNILPI